MGAEVERNTAERPIGIQKTVTSIPRDSKFNLDLPGQRDAASLTT